MIIDLASAARVVPLAALMLLLGPPPEPPLPRRPAVIARSERSIRPCPRRLRLYAVRRFGLLQLLRVLVSPLLRRQRDILRCCRRAVTVASDP
jgi:hypothetical protein